MKIKKTWTTADIIKASKGELLSEKSGTIIESITFNKISIDSRNALPTDFFIAIKGKNFDGHDFIYDALAKGVKGIMINNDKARSLCKIPDKTTVILVKDTTFALGELAKYHRKRSKAKIIAVTGSNGKTTTREMICSVLSEKFKTLSARKSFNNEIGVPLTLLELCPEHNWAVLELGMNQPGEIRRLSEICKPDVAVVTNVGSAHIGFLKTKENIAAAKSEILENTDAKGFAVLNADDPYVFKMADKTDKKVLFYGLYEDKLSGKKLYDRAFDTAEIKGKDILENAYGTAFRLVMGSKEKDIQLKIHGRFMVYNALAAACAGVIACISIDRIAAGLEKFLPVTGRMNIIKANGFTIIDDVYNANPQSMAGALNTFTEIANKDKARAIAVFGDMAELGEHSEKEHEKLGELAAKSGTIQIYANGKFAQNIANGAAKNLFYDVFIGTKQEVICKLRDQIKKGDFILIKGSRASSMEQIVEGIKNYAV